jgi:predicted O-methyltransferase YrrM
MTFLTTLSSEPVAGLLDTLFDDITRSTPTAQQAFAHVPSEERDRLMRSKTEYLDLYSRLKDLALPVSRETGSLLYMLARSVKARVIVEFGTSLGISTLHLASALRDNGGGRLITSEFEPSKIARARQNLTKAELIDLVEIREGDALETLGHDMPEKIDILLLDGAKALYADILGLLENRLTPGAFVIADNTDFCPEYLERVRAKDSGYISVPFAEDVELSMRSI